MVSGLTARHPSQPKASRRAIAKSGGDFWSSIAIAGELPQPACTEQGLSSSWRHDSIYARSSARRNGSVLFDQAVAATATRSMKQNFKLSHSAAMLHLGSGRIRTTWPAVGAASCGRVFYDPKCSVHMHNMNAATKCHPGGRSAMLRPGTFCWVLSGQFPGTTLFRARVEPGRR